MIQERKWKQTWKWKLNGVRNRTAIRYRLGNESGIRNVKGLGFGKVMELEMEMEMESEIEIELKLEMELDMELKVMNAHIENTQ